MKYDKAIFYMTAICIVFLISLPCDADIVHTVKRGETLYAISKTYHVSIEALSQANDIKDPGMIRPGMTVTIPNTYVVEKGDTLFGIAKKAGSTVEKIAELNSFSKDKKLKIGEIILLPFALTDTKVAQNVEKKEITSSKNESPPVKKTESLRQDFSGDMIWPHPGARSALTGKLKGTQIEGKVGDEVRTVNSGKVVWVAPYRGYGKMVMVESDDRSIFGYAGNGETSVHVGERVEKGTIIGRIGGDDASGKGRVYFFVFKDGKPIEFAKN
jgi:lipoprotein YgeR